MSTTMSERSLHKNDWPLVQIGGLTLIRSPQLSQLSGFTHAFTTRLGGATPAPLNSFNLGRHLADESSREDAMRNRRALCEAIALDFDALTVPGQQHTTNIHLLKQGDEKGPVLPNFDGVATRASKHPVMLHFADCVPVIIVDPVAHALCVVHAGWRGTAGGISSKAVQLLVSHFGSDATNIQAAVGPAIGSCCYETGDDVAEQLSATVPNAEPLIARRNNRPYPDLKAFNAMQLYEAGVKSVDVSSWCTACHPELFYSHRQSGGKTGRQAAVASLL